MLLNDITNLLNPLFLTVNNMLVLFRNIFSKNVIKTASFGIELRELNTIQSLRGVDVLNN